jgi:hypothetical protein
MYIPGDPKEALEAIKKYMSKPGLTAKEIDVLLDAAKEAQRRVNEDLKRLKG